MVGHLVSFLVPLLLAAEVGVDKKQGLHGQGLQLQIPGRVVGGDVTHRLHLPAQQPLVSIVIVEVGHPLPRPAAEFAHIVGSGRGGDQGQIHVHLEPPPDLWPPS